MSTVPEIRIERQNEAPPAKSGRYVLYWMIAARRAHWNFALQRAVEWARELSQPLVIFEPLRIGYPWASDRLHRFVLEGMTANAQAFAESDVSYYPYVEPKADADKGLLEALAAESSVVVTDDFPCFFLPRMVSAVGRKLPVPLEAVDSNGLLPLRATDDVFPTAYAFRRFLQRELPRHFESLPQKNPLAGRKLAPLPKLDSKILKRWPAAELDAGDRLLASLPIDHSVGPAAFAGGADAAEKTLSQFLSHKQTEYLDSRNEPESEVSSGLSPYLHFGHIAAHEVFARLTEREGWTPDAVASKASGKRSGWWGLSESGEAFLDQLITWRELGFNMSSKRDDYDRYESLPEWAQKTLKKHAQDDRPTIYSLEEFESAETHDPLWNAAQRQLVREGRMHNYLRMLWGKKILEWSPTPQEALAAMIELNNKYAVDGRDPNSYSGIFWCLGRYDRAWGPERPIFGTVRYMSSDNTARKLHVRGYIEKYGPGA